MCRFPASISVWISWRRRGVKFCSSADPLLEVVWEAHYRWTEPVWTDQLASRIKGVSIVQSDNDTGPSIDESNVITVTVFGNLYEEKKSHSCTWWSVRPPVCPKNSSSHFCPKNSVCHQQKTLTHWVFVMKINHRDRQPSGPRHQWTFPRKTAFVSTSESDSFQFKKRTYLFITCLRSTGDTWETPWKHTDIIMTPL